MIWNAGCAEKPRVRSKRPSASWRMPASDCGTCGGLLQTLHSKPYVGSLRVDDAQIRGRGRR
jgi:hypothetical protein